ncbi:unnamed protein product, partial [Ixodes persulcatus]
EHRLVLEFYAFWSLFGLETSWRSKSQPAGAQIGPDRSDLDRCHRVPPHAGGRQAVDAADQCRRPMLRSSPASLARGRGNGGEDDRRPSPSRSPRKIAKSHHQSPGAVHGVRRRRASSAPDLSAATRIP